MISSLQDCFEDPELELAGLIDPLLMRQRGCRSSLAPTAKKILCGSRGRCLGRSYSCPRSLREYSLLCTREWLRLLWERLIHPEQIQELTDLSREKDLGIWSRRTLPLELCSWCNLQRKQPSISWMWKSPNCIHDKKKDVPSGTAIKTAESTSEKREKIQQGCSRWRRVDVWSKRGRFWRDVRIHSVRLPGLVAHQEVIWWPRRGLTSVMIPMIVSFMTGVNLEIKEVVKRHELVYGLEHLLWVRKDAFWVSEANIRED